MVSLKFSLGLEAAAKLSDILACLAKFSDTVFLEARKDVLTLSTLNSSKSAYCAFNLDKAFFLSYTYNPAPQHATADSRFTCSIANRALTSVFRSRVIDPRGKDTGITRCDISLHETDETTACRFVIKLICTHGITKTYRLTYESVEVLHALFDRNNAPNQWAIRAGHLREFLDFFAPKAEQLDIYSDEGKVTFISFTEKVVNSKAETLKHPMKTSVALDQNAFELFDAQEGIHTILSVKDFRAIVTHANTLLNTSISAYYGAPGRPLQFHYSHEGMQCQFTLMTANIAGSAGSEASTSRAQSRASTARPRASRPHSGHGSRTADNSFVVDHMPPPAVPDSRSRRAAGQLGQSGGFGSATPAASASFASRPPAGEEDESLFVPRDGAGRDDGDAQWDAANYGDDGGMDVGWDTNANPDDAPYGSVRDTVRDTTANTSRNFSMDGASDALPPTQRISQIRGLW